MLQRLSTRFTVQEGCLHTLNLMCKALKSCWNWVHAEYLNIWTLLSAGGSSNRSSHWEKKDSLYLVSSHFFNGAVYTVDNLTLIQGRWSLTVHCLTCQPYLRKSSQAFICSAQILGIFYPVMLSLQINCHASSLQLDQYRFTIIFTTPHQVIF